MVLGRLLVGELLSVVGSLDEGFALSVDMVVVDVQFLFDSASTAAAAAADADHHQDGEKHDRADHDDCDHPVLEGTVAFGRVTVGKSASTAGALVVEKAGLEGAQVRRRIRPCAACLSEAKEERGNDE